MQKLQEKLRSLYRMTKEAFEARLPFLTNFLKTKTKNLRTQMTLLFNALVRKGGLRLKIVTLVASAVLITAVVLGTLVIQLMKGSIENKAFELTTTSIEQIAHYSTPALLDRSYDNRMELNHKINEIRLAKIEGLLDVSIYERQKSNSASAFKYMAGFGRYDVGTLLDDARLIGSLNDATPGKVTYEIVTEEGAGEAYRFVKPILHTVEGRTYLLGVAILLYDKAMITGSTDRVIRITLLSAAFLLLAAIILVYFAVLRIINPILAVTDAARDVSRGNMDIELDITTCDEVEELAEQFNRMVAALKEEKTRA